MKQEIKIWHESNNLDFELYLKDLIRSQGYRIVTIATESQYKNGKISYAIIVVEK